VQAKIIKLVGLKNGGRLSPINLVTFAGTQNGEYLQIWRFSSDIFYGCMSQLLFEYFSILILILMAFSNG
jgi:hypothetical protein